MVHSVKVPEATTLGKPRLNLMCGWTLDDATDQRR